MDQATGKCNNPDCSQFGMEKSVVVAITYGYRLGKNSVICPECDNALVVKQRQKLRQRVARILDSIKHA